MWGHGSRITASTGNLLPLRKAGNLFPKASPTIKSFKEAGSRSEQGQLPCTAQTPIAHPQPSRPGTPSQTPNFPPPLPPPSKAGKNRQLVQSKGSQNNARKSRVGNPVPIHAAGKKVKLSPLRFDGCSGDGGGKRQAEETASQEFFGAGFTPCQSQARAPDLSFRPPEGSQLHGGMNGTCSPSP